MDKNIFNESNIFFDHESKTQDEAFSFIADQVTEAGYANSAETFFKGLKDRELESTTGFKNGISIPHSNNESVIKPGLFIIKFDNEIEWNALDKKPVKVAIALSIPKDGAKEHLKLLSKIARKLMDEDFTSTILNTNEVSVLAETVNEIEA